MRIAFFLAAIVALAAIVSFVLPVQKPPFTGPSYTVEVQYEEGIPREHLLVTVSDGVQIVFDAPARVLQQRIEALEYEIAINKTEPRNQQARLNDLNAIQVAVNRALQDYPDISTTTKRLPTR